MKTYEATIIYDASAAGSVSVDADSIEQAVDRLTDLAGEHYAGLCHQCSDSLNLGDQLGLIVYCDGQEVADTTYHGDRIAKLEAEAKALREERNSLDRQLTQLTAEAAAMEEELEALHARVVVPDGYALVPAVATDYMVEHVMATGLYHDKNAYAVLRDEYRHMVEAAPRLNGKAVSEGLLRRTLEFIKATNYQGSIPLGLIAELSELLGEGKES